MGIPTATIIHMKMVTHMATVILMALMIHIEMGTLTKRGIPKK